MLKASEEIIEKIVDYAYGCDTGHMVSLLEALLGAIKTELEAKLADLTAERDALKAELDAAKNQKPAGYMAKDTAVTCVYTAERCYGDFSSCTPVYAKPIPAQQLAELEALRNQKPVGEWRVHSKNRAGEEFGRLISEQRFEDGQKFYTSPVPQQLEVIESAIFQVDVYVINGEHCITGSQIKKILQEQEFVRLKKEANNKKTEDL